jgi:predicted TIM-barrel fold metal-dependent hydrolase
MTALSHFIEETPLIDTHEHLYKETQFVQHGPDVLQALFDNYVAAELIVAGAAPEAVQKLVNHEIYRPQPLTMDSTTAEVEPLWINLPDTDLKGRFSGVFDAWQRCQHTGYGEAVRLIAQRVYGMDEITPDSIEAAVPRHAELRKPGERLRMLRDIGNLDHVQVDDFAWQCLPDPSGLDFFLYDISWHSLSNGQVNPEIMHRETGVEVSDLNSLQAAMEAIFARYAACAVAVKAQHAYQRTLLWQERDRLDVERCLQKLLRGPELTPDERACLGDWCWARGVDLAAEHNLPFKIHTGYYAGYSSMIMERIRPGHLCALVMRYPATRFVLMHIAYPYHDEISALAKHFPNVYVDMCWAWSIDPYSASNFVRRMIHSVPGHKLFAFGGDSFWPTASVAYAIQARQWLNRALQAEIDDGLLNEAQAIALAHGMMHTNQEACFDIEGTRAAIRKAAQRA